MNTKAHILLLADDDPDDRIFFKEALEDLPFSSTLTTVNDGVELMQLLAVKEDDLPHMLFLDLNMPLKTGMECLMEIKLNKKLNRLPVIIFSTSFDQQTASLLYENGAHYYLRKPGEFAILRQLIQRAISLTSASDKQPPWENFVLWSE